MTDETTKPKTRKPRSKTTLGEGVIGLIAGYREQFKGVVFTAQEAKDFWAGSTENTIDKLADVEVLQLLAMDLYIRYTEATLKLQEIANTGSNLHLNRKQRRASRQ